MYQTKEPQQFCISIKIPPAELHVNAGGIVGVHSAECFTAKPFTDRHSILLPHCSAALHGVTTAASLTDKNNEDVSSFGVSCDL
jgi:hypothetical protein